MLAVLPQMPLLKGEEPMMYGELTCCSNVIRRHATILVCRHTCDTRKPFMLLPSILISPDFYSLISCCNEEKLVDEDDGYEEYEVGVFLQFFGLLCFFNDQKTNIRFRSFDRRKRKMLQKKRKTRKKKMTTTTTAMKETRNKEEQLVKGMMRTMKTMRRYAFITIFGVTP